MVDLLDFSEKIKTFYLIRHGETEATAGGRICGHLDVDLTEEGVDQAEIVGDWLSVYPMDSIYCSPLKRTVQTADVVAKFTKLPTFFKHSGLLEKNEGEWEGKTYWEIRDNDAKLWEKWSKDPINFAPPGGESVKDFVGRVGRAIEDIRKNYENGSKIVLITHAGVIKASIMNALDIPVENFFRIDIPTASISCVDWSDSYATMRFCGLNPTIHELMVG